ncbi:hypothetical protein HO133_002885 [Letharia lupina]|uniref:F-box domain-containing protein n=1 Tax=Letharia lupina TaxID=560253 RepID=A0A8H6CBF8_9LECA|nr:uncharacterized protein HO133_002885 [Letharia lupina]KAF6220453.1 hypothetical protein HO133_002885 [Letharia lupina]
MASFQSLPNELLEVIVNNLPRQDLPHIRLTCSRLAQIATKPMFRKLVLGTSTESGKGFVEILASEELRTCVSQLTFNSFQVGQRVCERGAATLPNEVIHTLRNVCAFENLGSVCINLPWNRRATGSLRNVVPQQYHFQILDMILAKLLTPSGRSLPIKTLALHNLPSKNTPVTEKKGFDRFLGRLSTLQLGVWMHDKGVPESRDHIDLSIKCLDFFAKLPVVWLTPAQNLSTLALCSDDHWGYYPKVDIEKTYFPSLQALVLGKLCFSHDSKLEWLLKHATSLQKLYLVDCSILREAFFLGQQDNDGYPAGRIQRGNTDQRSYTYERCWSYYLMEMSLSLKKLTRFVMHSRKSAAASFSSWRDIPPSRDERYIRLFADGVFEPCTVEQELTSEKEDWDALANLLEVTTARSNRRRGPNDRQFEESIPGYW